MRTVAVIGASSDRSKFGNKAVRAFARRGYTVVPVHPTLAEVEGFRAYPSIIDVPGRVDLATFYVPPEVGAGLLEEVARKGVQEVWLNPGSESPAVVELARALGLQPILACSILSIGERPADY